MTDPMIAALLSAFYEAELALPWIDADPPDESTATEFLNALAERGFRIVPKDEAD